MAMTSGRTYQKLPEGFKQEWVKALRSGIYKQGMHNLELTVANDQKLYCCMGVAVKCTGNDITKDIVKSSACPFSNYDTHFAFIPHELRRDHRLQMELAKLNDVQGLSFEEIAAWIEVNL